MSKCGRLWIGFFAVKSSEGDLTGITCDGQQHFHVLLRDGFENWEELSISYVADCDGACRSSNKKAELVAQFERLRVETLLTDSGELSTQVNISAAASLLLSQDQIECCKVSEWYVKRSEQGVKYRLADGRFLTVTENFDWWSCNPSGLFKSVQIEVSVQEDSSLVDANAYLQDSEYLQNLWHKIQTIKAAA